MSADLRLTDVYKKAGAVETLYRLLGERESHVNISHRRMPSLAEHRRFVKSRPYRAWYLIQDGSGPAGDARGAIYLSKAGEIGVFIFKVHRGRGYGEAAIRLLMSRHASTPRFLANISPANPDSIRLFERLGFTHIQNTYERMDKKGKRRRQ